MNRLLVVLLAGLAIAGPAAASDPPYAELGLPESAAPRLCADRQISKQVAWMQAAGWPVQMPVVSVTPGATFRVGGMEVAAVTYLWEDRWYVQIPRVAERGLCRLWVGANPSTYSAALAVVFHEVLHQVWNEGDDWGHRFVVPQSLVMVNRWSREYRLRRYLDNRRIR